MGNIFKKIAKSIVDPLGLFSSDDVPDVAGQEAAAAAARAKRMKEGTAKVQDTFNQQYTPEYYQNLRNQLDRMQRPEMEMDFQNAQSQMLFNLARQGLAGGGRASNTANRNYADLDFKKGKAELALQRNADNIVNKRKQAVLGARNSIIGQMQESGDVGSALTSAQQSIDANTAVPEYNPLGDVFSTAGKGLLTYNQNKMMKGMDDKAQGYMNSSAG